jgi:hypothetical protein
VVTGRAPGQANGLAALGEADQRGNELMLRDTSSLPRQADIPFIVDQSWQSQLQPFAAQYPKQ